MFVYFPFLKITDSILLLFRMYHFSIIDFLEHWRNVVRHNNLLFGDLMVALVVEKLQMLEMIRFVPYHRRSFLLRIERKNRFLLYHWKDLFQKYCFLFRCHWYWINILHPPSHVLFIFHAIHQYVPNRNSLVVDCLANQIYLHLFIGHVLFRFYFFCYCRKFRPFYLSVTGVYNGSYHQK